jgi:hypothetical protein
MRLTHESAIESYFNGAGSLFQQAPMNIPVIEILRQLWERLIAWQHPAEFELRIMTVNVSQRLPDDE